MTDPDLQRQLADLKQEVAALSAARAAAAAEPEPPVDPVGLTDADDSPFEQVEELVQLLEKELRDNPVVSGLAIFAAGVLVGRLLR